MSIKIVGVLALFCCLAVSESFSQENLKHLKSDNADVKTMQSSGLLYAPEMPEQHTYKIVKNTLKQEIDSAVLKQINFHRRNEDYLWKVNDDIEILIYAINRLK